MIIPIDFSKIYLSYDDFINFKNKISILKKNNEKKIQKNKINSDNQKSFYFEDYLETNQNKKEI